MFSWGWWIHSHNKNEDYFSLLINIGWIIFFMIVSRLPLITDQHQMITGFWGSLSLDSGRTNCMTWCCWGGKTSYRRIREGCLPESLRPLNTLAKVLTRPRLTCDTPLNCTYVTISILLQYNTSKDHYIDVIRTYIHIYIYICTYIYVYICLHHACMYVSYVM